MLIGLTGRKQSGKSTVAGLLKAHGFIEHSFADPIRAFVGHILDMTPAELEAAKEMPIGFLGGVTPRQMMQTIGTEWGRQTIHPELWVRSLQLRVEPLVATGQRIVISDIRFDNEAQAIRAIGGRVVRVERPGPNADRHVSEAGVSGRLVDFSLYNGGGIIELASAVDLLVDAGHRIPARSA